MKLIHFVKTLISKDFFMLFVRLSEVEVKYRLSLILVNSYNASTSLMKTN